MKARHLVTLLAVLVPLTLLVGVLWRLRGASAGDAERDPGAAEMGDSLRAAIQSSAGAAFSTEIALPVEGGLVRRDTFVLWVKAEGRAAAVRSAPLQAEVAGPVISVPVREGSYVAGGDLIVHIDPTEYRLQVKRAESDLAFAQSEYEGLLVGSERLDPETRQRRERSARIRSKLSGAEASLEEAQFNLERTEIRAPFAGRIANLAVDEGARLQVGDSVAEAIDISRIDVEVEVLERGLPHVAPGHAATVRFGALPDETFKGTVATVNPMVDRETGTARVTVRLANPRSRILPGMFAEVELAGQRFEGRLLVPRNALVERDRRDVVFLLVPDEVGGATGLAKWVYVQTGLENDRFVEITPEREGDRLEAGMIVLVGGHTTLTHDARVRLENASELEGSGAPPLP